MDLSIPEISEADLQELERMARDGFGLSPEGGKKLVAEVRRLRAKVATMERLQTTAASRMVKK